MLDPRGRRQLLEALQPPPGYALDHAIGTTFSLDLLALLTAPLAFTFFDWEMDDGRPQSDPLALLEAIRRNADRITIFCQAGRITIPGGNRLLLSYLEQTVVEVLPPGPGVFHPKVWVLRYIGADQSVTYRVLCMSRNLTFDRSWDTLLALDGVAAATEQPATFPLSDFVGALPGLARHTLPEELTRRLAHLGQELRYTSFTLPDGFDDIRFWPLGLAGSAWPFQGRIDRLAVISPFITPACLERLAGGRQNNSIISRPESLAALPSGVLAGYEHAYVLSPDAEPEFTDDGPAEVTGLSGLHAKLYVADAGWRARVWTGSANATNAAFSSNVEFLIELAGPVGRFGVNALLGPQADGGLQALLKEVRPTAQDTADVTRVQLQEQLERARRVVAHAVHGASAAVTENGYALTLALSQPLDLAPGVGVRCWPATLPATHALQLTPGAEKVTFAVSFEALTTFWAFELTATTGTATEYLRFVCSVPLAGAPEDRRERLLGALLENRVQVVRLLLLMLSESGADITMALRATEHLVGDAGNGQGSRSEFPLLEALIRALDRDPHRLDQVARLVGELQRTATGAALLPDEWDQIWAPIWAARKETP